MCSSDLASTTINASVIDVYPRAAEVMLENKWEFMGHGWTQKALQNEPDEAAVIDKCKDRIERFSGQKMRGWLGAGLSETMHTPDVLKPRGVDYVCDWVIDDLPTWMTTRTAITAATTEGTLKAGGGLAGAQLPPGVWCSDTWSSFWHEGCSSSLVKSFWNTGANGPGEGLRHVG